MSSFFLSKGLEGWMRPQQMEIDRKGFPGRRHRFEPWNDHRRVSGGALNVKLRSGVNLAGNRENCEQESYMI